MYSTYTLYNELNKIEYILYYEQIPDEVDNPIIENCMGKEEEEFEEEESQFDILKETDEQIAENDIEINEDEDIEINKNN